MFDPLVHELSQRYGLGDRGRDLFGLLMAYIHNDRRGGFGGFIEGFREQGHGELVASWLGNPEAGGLNASDVGTVFGQGLLNDWGTRLGASRATVAAAIAGVLPRLVGALTPGGRVPGGFGAAATLGSPIDRPAAPAAPPHAEAPASFNVRPGVEGLVADELHPSERPPAFAAAGPGDGQVDPGRIVPGADRGADATGFGPPMAEPASQPLRREPSFAASPAVRAPVQSRREHDPGHDAVDPAERRIAEMTAAFGTAARRDDARDAEPANVRPETWRPAVHPPHRRRGWGWLFWLLVLLVLLAAGGWYLWELGLLDPYIRQFGLPLQTAQPG